MRALIFLLTSCCCCGHPVLQEPIYVLLSQPVSSPAQDLTSAISKYTLQDTPVLSVSSSGQEVIEGQFSSLPSVQDLLLEGGVLVPDASLAVEPVTDTLTVGDRDVRGVFPVVDEGDQAVNEAFPILETLTVLNEYPLVNDGLLVAVTLTFLEDGTQALKGASLVDSSFITRQEIPVVEAASPVVNAVAVRSPLKHVSLKKVPSLAERVTTGRAATPDVEDASAAVDSAPLVMAAESVTDPARDAKTTSPVDIPVPAVKTADPVADLDPVAKTTGHTVDPVPVVKSSDPVVEGLHVVKATDPVVDTLSVVKVTDPVVAPVVKAVAAVAAASPVVVAAPEPLLAPEPPMPSAATPFVGGQFHAQDEAGQYSFGHWGGPNTRFEIQDSLGRTSGSFAYVDPEGEVQVRKYASASGSGFRVAASDLPLDTAAHTHADVEDLVGRPVVSKA